MRCPGNEETHPCQTIPKWTSRPLSKRLSTQILDDIWVFAPSLANLLVHLWAPSSSMDLGIHGHTNLLTHTQGVPGSRIPLGLRSTACSSNRASAGCTTGTQLVVSPNMRRSSPLIAVEIPGKTGDSDQEPSICDTFDLFYRNLEIYSCDGCDPSRITRMDIITHVKTKRHRKLVQCSPMTNRRKQLEPKT